MSSKVERQESKRKYSRDARDTVGNRDGDYITVSCRNDAFSRRKMNKHYTITLGEVTHSIITKAGDVREMLSVMSDTLKGHRDLYQHAHIIHGYINVDTISVVEGTRQGVLKDWDMPLSKLLIDTRGYLDHLISETKEDTTREDVMQKINAVLATENERSLSLLKEQGITVGDDIDRGEQLRRSIPQK